MIKATTLRPGFLVSLKTSLVGNVTYRATTLESEHVTESGELLAKWETEKTVSDPVEHEKGIKARGLARTAITRVCSVSTFGLLCPESRAEELLQAIQSARAIANEFNATAVITRLNVGVIVGKVASDDESAVRAINSEVRQLMEDMEKGLKSLDVESVREAANKARSLGQMLSADAEAKVQRAIDSARSVARRMVKAGELAARELDQATLNTLASVRTAFLDLEDGQEIGAVSIDARALDLAPAIVDPLFMPEYTGRQLEV